MVGIGEEVQGVGSKMVATDMGRLDTVVIVITVAIGAIIDELIPHLTEKKN